MMFFQHFLAPNQTVPFKKIMLKTPQLKNFTAWAALRQQSRLFLEPWEPTWDEGEFNLSSFRRRIHHYHYLIRSDQAYPFFIFRQADNQLLGAITLNHVRRNIAQTGTIGYWIGAPYAGQGYMTQSLLALVNYAFQDLGLHRVEAACLPQNQASKALLHRCHFSQEGYAKSYLKIAGHWQDHCLFARVQSEFNS